VLDLLEQQVTDLSGSFEFFQKLRQELKLDDSKHFAMIEEIAATQPEILASFRTQPASPEVHDAVTLAKTLAKRPQKSRFSPIPRSSGGSRKRR
jgi:hypothetical protein